MVGKSEVIVDGQSAARAPGPLCAEAGTRAAAPFPAPLSPPAASILRFASDRFLLTKPNTSCTIELPASLRSDGVRDHPGMPFGIIPASRSASPESPVSTHENFGIRTMRSLWPPCGNMNWRRLSAASCITRNLIHRRAARARLSEFRREGSLCGAFGDNGKHSSAGRPHASSRTWAGPRTSAGLANAKQPRADALRLHRRWWRRE